MLIFRILVTVHELCLTLALSGDPSMCPKKQLRPALHLGLWISCSCSEFVTKGGKTAPNCGTQFPVFYSGFHSRRRSPPRLRNLTQSEPQRNCQYDSAKITIVS